MELRITAGQGLHFIALQNRGNWETEERPIWCVRAMNHCLSLEETLGEKGDIKGSFSGALTMQQMKLIIHGIFNKTYILQYCVMERVQSKEENVPNEEKKNYVTASSTLLF
jgi:hypothetical protein